MMQCDICGHTAERGSICHDCRSAIKRARDQTVSQFQGMPALAAAASGASPEVRQGRSPGARRSGRSAAPPSRSKPDPATARKAASRVPAARHDRLPAVAAGTRSSPFVWVIVTLMVFVVTYVAYRTFTTVTEGALPPPAAAEASEPIVAPASPRARNPGRGAPPPATDDAEPAPMPAAEPLPAAALPGRNSSVPARSSDAPAATVVAPPGRPAEIQRKDTRSVAPAAPAGRPREARPVARDREMPRVDNAPLPPARATATAEPANGESEPAAPRASLPAPSAPVSPLGRSRDATAGDHWQRMAASIRNCAGGTFLGALLCEQKVRLEFCEGWWGKAPECPSGLPNEHG